MAFGIRFSRVDWSWVGAMFGTFAGKIRQQLRLPIWSFGFITNLRAKLLEKVEKISCTEKNTDFITNKRELTNFQTKAGKT